MRARNVLAAAGLAAAAALSGCGSGSSSDEGSGESACFYQCESGASVCFYVLGLDRKGCESEAKDDCGGNPKNLKLETGCSCPGFDEPGECTPPPWAM